MNTRILRFGSVLGPLALASLLGCASPGAPAEGLDPALRNLVLPEVPSDVETPTLVDFSGKVHLVGYRLEPDTRAAPRSTLNLKLYWRSISRLSKGWKAFTRLEGAGAEQSFNFDDTGTLRQKLPPSEWVPGNVYLDEQELAVPADVTARELLLTVGFEHEPLVPEGEEAAGLSKHRLEILSGVSDGAEGAVLARLPTGVSERRGRPSKRRARPSGDDKRRMPLGPKLLDHVRPGAGERVKPGAGNAEE